MPPYPFVEKGEGIAIYPPYINTSRTCIDVYSTPIFTEKVVVFCRDDVVKKFIGKNFPADFRGVRLGINAGYLLGNKWNTLNLEDLKIEESRDTESNIRKLGGKHLECYANDANSILYTLKNFRRTDTSTFNNLNLVEVKTISEKAACIGYSANFKSAYRNDFIAKANASLEEVKSSGEIKETAESYLK